MFVRIGIVAVALVLLAAILGGASFIFGYLRLTDHGIEFGYKEPPHEVAVSGPNGVSVDDLLKRKGIEFVDPDQAAQTPATHPAAAGTNIAATAPAVGQQPDHVAGIDGRSKDGIIRVSAGSTQPLTDPDGHVWEAANGFEGGEIADRGEFRMKVRFPGLYRYERFNVTAWHCRLPNGSYKVTLHFAEGFDGIRGAKQRFFGVEVQGEPMDPIDIFRESGGLHRELLRSAPALVTNGTLTVNFLPSRSRFPNLVNGIEVTPDSPAVAARIPVREEGKRKFTDLRIAAASSAALRDPDGKTWFADSGFEGGQTADRGPIYVRGTEFPDVYRHERYGMTAWHAELPDGNYTVNLHFAETSPSVSRAGQRIFNIIVKDQPLRDFDVFKESGGKNVALVKTFHVSITDGKLTILFQPVAKDKNVPEINGIEVIRER